MNFHGGNDCCVVLKSRTEVYAFTDHPNTIHHPLWLLPRRHRAAGELSDTLRKRLWLQSAYNIALYNGGDFVGL